MPTPPCAWYPRSSGSGSRGASTKDDVGERNAPGIGLDENGGHETRTSLVGAGAAFVVLRTVVGVVVVDGGEEAEKRGKNLSGVKRVFLSLCVSAMSFFVGDRGLGGMSMAGLGRYKGNGG